MISDKNRSGWFGASDCSYIMGNWKTKTFQNWWLIKLGLDSRNFATRAMNAGTYYERAVLDYVEAPRRDYQILIPEYSLRINYDGDGPGQIDEVKTHKAEKQFKVSKAYWQQMQVQMFGKLREESAVPCATIHAYGLIDTDYINYFNPIDPRRLTHHHITYDRCFIAGYLQRLTYLKECLEKGVFPKEGAL